MSGLQKDQLVRRLQSLNNSQQSIEATAGWCIFFRKDARSVVQIWETEFVKATPEKKLALFYLANHILQESKKKGREFIDEYFRVLVKAVKTMTKSGDEKIKKSIGRVINIWEERRVYGSNHIRSLKEAVGGGGHIPSNDGSHNGVSGPEKKKLGLLGGLPDGMLTLSQAESHTADWANKSLSNLRQGLTENGTLDELTTAIQLLQSYQSALKAELAARDSVLQQLKHMISKQEDARTRSDDQLRLCGVQQGKLEERRAVLQRAIAPGPPYVPQQTTPTYMQDPSPVYQQPTPTYVPPPHTSPAPVAPPPAVNTFASVPVTQLSAPDTTFLGQLNSLAGVLNGTAGLNIPVAPTLNTSSLPSAVSALASLANFQPAPASPQPPKLDDYSPSAATVETKSEMDSGGLRMEELDPAYFAATLANSDDLARNLASALAQLPAEEREEFQRNFSALAQQNVGGDDEEEYNPEFGD